MQGAAVIDVVNVGSWNDVGMDMISQRGRYSISPDHDYTHSLPRTCSMKPHREIL